ncbi:MAG: nickel pincer cofactor biosynthesis protein LarC [Chloroflexi bacterium]|nr:nickel pincer cofactor biosynthesis protein LarC [Chloroflexota bacterium]
MTDSSPNTLIAYIDLSIGVSGDMLLAALLDVGLAVDDLQAAFDALGLPGLRFDTRRVTKQELAATQVQVSAPDAQPHRHLSDIERIIRASTLPARVQERSLSVFKRLAQAEAKVHGVMVEQVHFHEVGALDAIADIVGVVAGFDILGVEKIFASPIPLSHGAVHAAHGLLPVPPPAVLALTEGYPVRGIDVEGETVTPTGAALVTTLAQWFGPPPPMILDRVGYGAGQKDFAQPNVVRVWLGEEEKSEKVFAESADNGKRGPEEGRSPETLILLETNLDDMPAEWLGPLLSDLLDAGALDVWFTPIHMKKDRPALQLSALSPPQRAAELRALLFRHTTTLGIREMPVTRHALPRRVVKVETPFGPIRLKLAEYAPGKWKAAPEYEDCRAASQRCGIALAQVYAAALAAWRE